MQAKFKQDDEMRIRISATSRNVTMIQTYAPTADHKDENNYAFYEKLNETLGKVPKRI